MRALFAAVLLVASPAHVEPTVTSAPAGSRAELGFTVEHGCAGSPTVEMAMQLPVEVTDPVAVDLPGWTTTVEAPDAAGHVVVTWSGGPLPDGEPATFTVSVGLPPTPGVTLLFPTVQTCEQGELAWIAEEGGESETDNPAPRISLTELDPSVTTATTAAPTSTSAAPTTDGAGPETATTAPAADEAPADDGPGAGGWLLRILVAAGIGGLIGVGYGRIRRSRSGDRPPRS